MNVFSPENASLLVAVGTFMVAILAALAGLLGFVSAHRSSKYAIETNRAVLSAMRDSYEAQIARLSSEMTATEERWKDVNHLLISAQKNPVQHESFSVQPSTEFLRTLNLGPDDLTVDPKLVVVLTPFADEERGTFDAIQRACSRRGYRCIRGDEEYTPGDILSHVLRLIVKARVVIANVGTRNPNVFYELGFAHAMGKQTILVSRSIERVPFDVRALRILIWSDYDQLQTDVGEMLLRTVAETQGSPVVPQGLQPPPTRHG